jgi:CRISPR-associated endonuclease Cas2
MEYRGNVRVSQIILSVVKIAGVLAVAAVAPNAVQLLRHLPNSKSRTCYCPAYINETIKRMTTRGLIKLEHEKGQTYVKLTDKGQLELSRFQAKERMLSKKKWDGKWRVLIFDIKEYRRSTRDVLRKELIGFGFIRLQNSVWVNPYECSEITVLLKADLQIGKDLLYMTVEKLENDKWLRKSFALIN